MKIQELQREFKYNSVLLADPNPAFTLEQVRDFYSTVYPDILNAEIEGPEVKSNKNVYTFRRAVGTKGISHHDAPVRAYLESLKWDGVKRLDRWMIDLLSAMDMEYVRAVSRKWMIAAVARALNPGCRADNVLILVGEQGSGKSSALKILGGDWFTDTPLRLDDKDFFVDIHDKWIVEVAELGASNRVKSAAAKWFFSQTSDRYRNPYDVVDAVIVPRQQVFAGTTGSTTYLKDDAGNRRYWPVKVAKINFTGLKQWRDQLWAEAVAAFRAGENWWTVPEAPPPADAPSDTWVDPVKEKQGSILSMVAGLSTLEEDPLRKIVNDLSALLHINWLDNVDAEFVKSLQARAISATQELSDEDRLRLIKLHRRECSRSMVTNDAEACCA